MADDGLFSTDRFSRRALHPETWVGVAAGIATLLLLVGAVTDIAIQLSRDAELTPAAVSAASATSSAIAVPATVSGETPAPQPAPATAPAVSVIGSVCRPYSTTGKTADGSVAYCERVGSTDGYRWSLYPGDIPLPAQLDTALDQQSDPGVPICMTQTGRTASDCAEYLQGPSNPGDGSPGRPDGPR